MSSAYAAAQMKIAGADQTSYTPFVVPRKELKEPRQIETWLQTWGRDLQDKGQSGEMTLIGSAALLWHAYQRGIDAGLPVNSMDADPITSDDCVAELGYSAGIGSEFEAENGWHINLMPESTLNEFDSDWKSRQTTKTYGGLTVHVPAAAHLLAPKIRRGEPRDIAHYQWARSNGLISAEHIEMAGALRDALTQHQQKAKPK